MKVNLGKDTETPIKTYSISFNDKYEPKVVGRGITGGAKLQLMPGFEGYNESRAREWCSGAGVSCEFTTVNDANPEGQILTQSVHDGTLMKNVSSVTFVVSNGQGAKDKDKDKDKDDDDDDDEENEGNENGGNGNGNGNGNENNNEGGNENGGNGNDGNTDPEPEKPKPEPDPSEDETIDETGN